MDRYLEKQNKIASFIVSLVFIASIYNIIRQCANNSNTLNFVILGFLLSILFFRNLSVLIDIIRYDQKTLLLLLSIDIAVVMHSVVIGFSNGFDLLRYQAYIFLAIFMFLIGRRLGNSDVLISVFCDRSFLFLVLFSMIIFKKNEVVYSMGYSYLILPILCSVLYKFIVSKKNLYFYELIVFLLLIIMYGSRGCLVSVCVFFFLCCRRKYLSLIFIVLCGVFLYTIGIGDQILSLMDKLDIESRTLRLLFGDLGHDSGRGEIYSNFIEMIENRPILGYGVASDIALVGMYPHNVFLEIIFDFGFVIGSVVIAFITIVIITSLNRHETTITKKLLFSISCVPLMFSLSYITTPFFWLFLGTCFKKNNANKY